MSHQILMFLALIGPILLIAAGIIAHVWDSRRERLQAVDGKSPSSTGLFSSRRSLRRRLSVPDHGRSRDGGHADLRE